MALPTPTNTWSISANNTVYTNGANNTDSDGRRRDIADFLGTMVTQLITLGAGDIVCVGSSDGVTNVSPVTLNGTNLWLSGSTDFRASIYNHTSNSYSTLNSVWVILQLGSSAGSPQVLIAIANTGSNYSDPRYFYMWYSPTGAFGVPLAAWDRPTAVDEVLVGF